MTGGDGTNFVINGSFDAPLEDWSANGTHSVSRRLESGGYLDDGPCGLISATGAGSGFQAAFRYSFPDRPEDGTRVKLSFKIRALSGESAFIARSRGLRPLPARSQA